MVAALEWREAAGGVWPAPATATSELRCAFINLLPPARPRCCARGRAHSGRFEKIALVAGAFGGTVSAAMKTLSAKAKIHGLTAARTRKNLFVPTEAP